MPFKKLEIIEPILKSLQQEGYTIPTPIQQQAIPVVLKGRDLLGCAQTGTGKTAAFAIPIIQLLHNAKQPNEKGPRTVKSLILTPTRELAVQIAESFAAYGRHTGLRHALVFGGVSQGPQADAIRRGVDIVIATPGRLLDLMDQRIINLSTIKIFVLDEADRMLDMGFINDINKVIAKLPQQRQTLFFSATMPPAIRKLADKILDEPVNVEVTPPSSTVDRIEQKVYFVNKANKRELLHHVLKDKAIARVLLFARTKHGADKITIGLSKSGIKAAAIHGNKSQNQRQNALAAFKEGKLRVLVATDIAARGIDVDNLTHVINYELPEVPETYVHRIGRTGRAGQSGIALSFCDVEEKPLLKDIQKTIGKQITIEEGHPYPMSHVEPLDVKSLPKFQKPKSQQSYSGGNKSYGKSSGGGNKANSKPGGGDKSHSKPGGGGPNARSKSKSGGKKWYGKKSNY